MYLEHQLISRNPHHITLVAGQVFLRTIKTAPAESLQAEHQKQAECASWKRKYTCGRNV